MTIDEALKVLGDLLHERGDGWLAELLREREFLFACVASAAEPHYTNNPGVERGCACSDRSYPRPHTLDRHHDATCVHGRLLRLLGGDAVTQRQVNASHECALSFEWEINRLRRREAARGGPRRNHPKRETPTGLSLFERLERENGMHPRDMSDPDCSDCGGLGHYDDTQPCYACLFYDDRE